MKIVEFTNKSSNNQRNTQRDSVSSIINQSKFELSEESDNNQGLAVAPNGMAAVEYDIQNNSFAVRPDNDLALDSQTLTKFKQDITACEKLATQLSRLGGE